MGEYKSGRVVEMDACSDGFVRSFIQSRDRRVCTPPPHLHRTHLASVSTKKSSSSGRAASSDSSTAAARAVSKASPASFTRSFSRRFPMMIVCAVWMEVDGQETMDE